MTYRLRRGVAAGLLLSVLLANAAAAAKPARDQFYPLDPTTLRDATGDVQLSDGGGPYALSQIRTAFIHDFATSQPDDDGTTQTQDYFYLDTGAGGARTTLLSSALASTSEFGLGSSQDIRCYNGYFFFQSAVTPEWYQELGPVGSSVKGWGTTGCYTAEDRGYHLVYPGHTAGGPAGECLTMTQSGADTLTLTAPSGAAIDPLAASCAATVYSFAIVDGTKRFTALGTESAPFELSLTLPPTRGKSGKR